MQDMRDCYDRLLSAAAATANSAYGKETFNFHMQNAKWISEKTFLHYFLLLQFQSSQSLWEKWVLVWSKSHLITTKKAVSTLMNFYFLVCIIFCFVTLFPSVGRILFMLGKVQYELQRLLDTYVSCLLQT